MTAREAAAARALINLQRGQKRPPVFCFHPLGGSAAPYGQLALAIGRDRLVYGVQSVGLLAGCPPDRTIAAMADRYAAEIGAAEPSGPALFLGYSMGGVLALETARRLRRSPTDSPLVLLVDCDPLYHAAGPGGAWHVLLHQVLNLDLPVERLAALPDRVALTAVRAAGARQGRLPARFSLDRLDRMLRVCQVNERATAEHVPPPYPGTVYVVRTAHAEPEPGTDSWEGFADEVVVSTVPVDHHGVLGPGGYPAVAARVRQLLAGIDRPSVPGDRPAWPPPSDQEVSCRSAT